VSTTLDFPLRLWRVVGATLAGLFFLTLTASAEDRATLLVAIHNLENPRNLTRPGAHGELGAYQFRLMTWRMHTTAPFAQALDREMSDYIAVKHYEWIKRGLLAARMPATDYNIALAWNGGLQAVIKRRSPSAAHQYAQRAVNLVAMLKAPAVSSAAAPTTTLPSPSFAADLRQSPSRPGL
jgi:hypothetical protein